jgi:hypothetical protein
LPGGISNYTGTPNASCYGSVILITGEFLTIDMPISGQQSIVNAQQNSDTGVVITRHATRNSFWGDLHSKKFHFNFLQLINPYPPPDFF